MNKLVFSKDFFKEENRDGFTVSEMMKRAWAAEMEVLAVVEDVCSKLGLRYYAMFGTLLGAVRHKGFIPWDDDIDVCMMRNEYMTFLKEAPGVLPEGFVISGTYSPDSRLRLANNEPQARVIADETFFTLPKYMDYFHAFPYLRVGVDIFPMDYLPDDPVKQAEMVTLCNDMQTTAAYIEHYRKEGTLKKKLIYYNEVTGGIDVDTEDDEILARDIRLAVDRLVSGADPAESEKVASILYLENPPKKDFKGYGGYLPEWFGQGCDLPYESITIHAPKEYALVLENCFGSDYMTPRPFTGLHEYPFYKNQEEAMRNLFIESGIENSVEEFCRNWHKMNGGT